MMRIAAVEQLEDCFDGSRVYTYHFDQAWTRESIQRLSGCGELDYFPDFPRPFFRLRGTGGLQIKGVEGLAHCRVVLPPKYSQDFRLVLEELLN
jgi:hypothetical protein